MEHFLDDTNDHNSSFFQPPTHDDEFEEVMEHSPSTSAIESTSPTKNDIKQGESVPVISRARANLNNDEEANIKLQVLVSNFSDEQLDRYEMYRRSAFPKVSIKRLMQSITGSAPSSNVVIAMAGIAKVFLGEIVEEALEIQRQNNNNNESKSTPLEPKHLREAYRRINTQYHRPQMKTWRSKRKPRF
jgi:transcription initiation factor TFIID subunit 11